MFVVTHFPTTHFLEACIPSYDCMQVKKQQLELDLEQHTGSKSGKEYIKAVYCHPAYLTYMRISSLISWIMLGQMKHSRNQHCWEKYQ